MCTWTCIHSLPVFVVKNIAVWKKHFLVDYIDVYVFVIKIEKLAVSSALTTIIEYWNRRRRRRETRISQFNIRERITKQIENREKSEFFRSREFRYTSIVETQTPYQSDLSNIYTYTSDRLLLVTSNAIQLRNIL